MTEAHVSSSSFSSLKPSYVAGYVVICLIWGSTWLAIRVTVKDIPPFEACGIRFLLAGIVLLSVAAGQRRKWPQGTDQWNAILLLSLTMMAIPFALVFWAEQRVFSSMAAILYSASPLVISMFTSVFMHQKVPRRAVLAMVVAFSGIVALLYTEPSTSRLALLSYGALLTAMTLSAWSVVYAKQRLHQVDPVVSTGLQLLFGSIALGWATWALESHRHAVWTRPAFIALAFLTVVGSCIAFVVYYWLLKHMQPYQIGTASLVIPVIAVCEGWLRGEAVRWMMMLLVVIILASVATALRAEAHAGSEIEALALRDAAE